MKTLIIGAGEVGKSLQKVLSPKHETHIRDIDGKITLPEGWPIDPKQGWDVLNICYPPGKNFIKITKDYIKLYNPHITIIHSTIPPGTTEKCGRMVVHSPIHGKHPDIERGILTYVKYLGGENPYAVHIAREFLSAANIKVKVVANSKTSELSKILCTTYYGWNIVFMKEVVKICEKYKVPFSEIYQDWNVLYNNGNIESGVQNYNRPVLKPFPGKIGGHCVVENCRLLKSDITDFIIKKNDEYGK